MGGLKKLKNVFGAAKGNDAVMQAMMMQIQSQQQADAIRASGEAQASAAREAQAAQTKQLQDQQVASNMALQQSMNQRTLSAQLAEEAPKPEREADVDLAGDVSTDTSDPRRKFQSNRSSGVGIKIA
tara:strand:- start:534 stop:914 length:381 start_codon:yes stop_codon:yes gene_type:complete